METYLWIESGGVGIIDLDIGEFGTDHYVTVFNHHASLETCEKNRQYSIYVVRGQRWW